MSERVSLAAKGFGSLYEEFDEDFFSEIIREYASSLLSMLLEQYDRAITTDPLSVQSMLESPLVSGFSPFWCPELAHCFAALKSDDPAGAARGLGQVLLNLSCSGAPGSWSIKFDHPCHFHWDHFLLPEAMSLEAQSDGYKAVISVQGPKGDQTFVFQSIDSTMRWHNVEAEVIPRIELEQASILLLTGKHIEQFNLPMPEFPTFQEIAEDQKESITSCLIFLREHFSSCSLWVERVLRYLCLVQSPPATMHSGSFEGHFGFSFMSDLRDPLKNAEMMIHECSHHYFSLLTRFTVLTEEDGRLYYSPFVRKDRPADRILMAYHAFANVELFYQNCIQAGFNVSRCKAAIAQLQPDLDFVERALVSDIHFTPVGRCIIDPLLTKRSQYEISD